MPPRKEMQLALLRQLIVFCFRMFFFSESPFLLVSQRNSSFFLLFLWNDVNVLNPLLQNLVYDLVKTVCRRCVILLLFEIYSNEIVPLKLLI